MPDSDIKINMNWDLSSYFREFDGIEMREFKDRLKEDIKSLRESAAPLSSLDDSNQRDWEDVFLKYEDIQKRFSHLSSYVGCLSSCDSNNESYLREEADLSVIGAELSKLKIVMHRAIKGVPEDVFSSFAVRDGFKGAVYYINRLREESRLRMNPEKETLATDLGVDGIKAWGRLYDTITGKLEFQIEFPDGSRKRLPISLRRSLMDSPDRRIRKAAFEGGNAAWKGIEDVAASALNAISGTRLTLNRYRGVNHFLDVALFQSAITRKTLDAMMEAILSEKEVPRKILELKAKTLGTDGVSWFDLGAPLSFPEQENISWDKCKTLVYSSFNNAFSGLGEFVDMVFNKNWIEWEPRSGKRPGGFCTGSMLTNESRIFMTFNGSLGDVLTLAHELGHAFHSHAMKDLRPFARMYPMTLAESASTFGELVLTNALLEDPSISDGQKALMLDTEINHGAIYLMDIPVRHEFEKCLYEERRQGELTVSQLKNLMVETQRKVFGDLLEEGGEDPYFWASKLHFYITDITFYNFPYTFGYLLSRGLYSMFRKEGSKFIKWYEEFLRSSGSDDAMNVASRFIGCDLESPDFWVDAIQNLNEPYERLKGLLPKILINPRSN